MYFKNYKLRSNFSLFWMNHSLVIIFDLYLHFIILNSGMPQKFFFKNGPYIRLIEDTTYGRAQWAQYAVQLIILLTWH